MRVVRKMHGRPFTMLNYILAAILILSTGVSACSLCQDDGQKEIAIANPDKRLGITSPVPLETCLDLSNALVVIPDNSDLCFQSRSLSSLCGCPVPAKACTICEAGSSMALPLQVLDGLVDLSENGSSFGLATTCELVKSAMNVYESDEQRCLDLPFDQLRQLCSCSTDGDDMQDDKSCNMCVGGETAIDRWSESIYFKYEGNLISCLDASRLVNNTEKGSYVCNAIQAVGTRCGCPISTNACKLCGGGPMREYWKEIVLENGEITDCVLLEAKLHLVEQSNQECSINKELFGSACGCEEEVKYEPCTFCPLGEPVPYPERNLSGLQGLGFDFIEHNCGILEKAATLVDKTNILCKSGQLISKLCGCATKANACSICGDGHVMTKPLAEAAWGSGKAQRFLLELVSPEVAAIADIDRKFTCELIDSFFSSLFEADDGFCFYDRLVRGHFCGCDGISSTGAKALVWIQRCSGALSSMGSLFIICFIFSSPRNSRWSIFHQLMFGISFFDILASVGFILGTLPVPEDTGIYGASGNAATCKLQGWMFQAGQISIYYNVALSTYFLLVIKHDWSDQRLQRISKYAHTGLVGVGLVLAFASIPFHEPNYRWCYVAWPPIETSYVPGLVFFLAPVGLCILVITILTIQLVHYVYKVDKRSKAKSFQKTAGKSMASRTFWQSLWYLGAFCLVWPVMFSTFVLEPTPHNFWFFIAGSVLGPSQGFFNACIFFNRQRKAVRNACMIFHRRTKVIRNASKVLRRKSEIIRMSILKKLGIQSEPNANIIPVSDKEVLATGAVALDAGISSGIDVPLCEGNFTKQSVATGDISTRPSVVNLDSSDSEDCKEEEGETQFDDGLNGA